MTTETTTIERGLRSLRPWIEASSILAAVLYAFGWIFAARLYGRFDVTPEEVGFGFSFLVVRVVFLVLAFLALSGALALSIQVARTYIEAFVVMDQIDYLPRLRYGLRLVRYALIAASVALLTVSPFLAADHYADNIERTGEMSTPVLPGISGIVVQRVQVTSMDGEPLSAELGTSACLSLFGASGGIAVLYDNEEHTVSRVSQGRISIDDPCT